MNIQRWTSALLGFPMLAAVLILGNKFVIDIVFTLVAIMCLHEYFSCFRGKAKPVSEIGYISALIIPFIHILATNQLIYLLLIIPITMVWVFLRIIISNMKITIYDGAVTILGIIYMTDNFIIMRRMKTV